MVELPRSLGPLIQVAGRINRIGQAHVDTRQWLLLGAGTVGEGIWSMIDSKHETFDTTIDGMARHLFDSYYQEKGQAA
jgi:hypothetical protein